LFSVSLVLLVGSVGSGKSFFYRRYFEVLIPQHLRNALKVVRVDLNDAVGSEQQKEGWILDKVLEGWRQIEGDSFESIENLKRIFAVDLNRLKKGPLHALYNHSIEQYELEVGQQLLNLMNDKLHFCKQVIRLYAGDSQKCVVIFFDNADTRTNAEQLEIFKIVQKLRREFRCISVLALRDETFDAYKDVPPLDTYQKPFAFRIHPPRFASVARKRLELALEDLAIADKRKEFTTNKGARVTYETADLPEYLRKIYESIFGTHRRAGQILEAVSGRNIRKSLEMFCEILRSGYLAGETIFKTIEPSASKSKSSQTITDKTILRALMRVQRRYYSSSHGYILNVFDCSSEDVSADMCLRTFILECLASRRKEPSSNKLEGFVQLRELCAVASVASYSSTAVKDEVAFLVKKGAISADAVSGTNTDLEDYFRVSAYGYFLVRWLVQRVEYLGNCAFDFVCTDTTTAKEISRFSSDTFAHTNARAVRLAKMYQLTLESKSFIAHSGTETSDYLTRIHSRIIETLGSAEEKSSLELPF
jgi:hypothetical protein